MDTLKGNSEFNVRDSIRKIVIKSNTYPPFSYVNRLPYDLAIKWFVHECGRFPEIKSAYVKHKNWTPGLSDIDLILIIQSNVNIEKEFSFLRSFWKQYDRIKQLFPMVGEVEILHDKDITAWTRFTIQGYEARYWTKLYGGETVRNNYAADPERIVLDSLNYALAFWRNNFLRKYYDTSNTPHAASLELQRVTTKVLKYIQYNDTGHKTKDTTHGPYKNKRYALRYIIRELEARVRSLSLPEGPTNPTLDSGELIVDADPREIPSQYQVVYSFLQSMSPRDGAVESILIPFTGSDEIFVIVKDDLDESVITTCIDITHKMFDMCDMVPIMVSRRVFEYMLRFYEPLLYSRFIKCRRVLYGRDLIPDIQPPETVFFFQCLLDHSVNILMYPQSHEVILPLDRDRFIKKDFYNCLLWFLQVKLHLEKKIIEAGNADNIMALCRMHYPEYYEVIRELQEKTGYCENEMGCLKRFGLLKNIADDISTYMSNYEGSIFYDTQLAAS